MKCNCKRILVELHLTLSVCSWRCTNLSSMNHKSTILMFTHSLVPKWNHPETENPARPKRKKKVLLLLEEHQRPKMAESIVTFFLEKLSNLVSHEASLLEGVEGQVKLLSNELEWMRLCLKDADAKSAYDERLKLWVNQIKDVTYDAEDIIDEFIIKVDHQQRQRLNYLKFLRFLPSCISLADRLPLVQELEAHIREIDIKIEKISANKSRYAIENLRTSDASSFSYEVMQRKEKRLPTVEEVDVVGVEDCNGLLPTV